MGKKLPKKKRLLGRSLPRIDPLKGPIDLQRGTDGDGKDQ